MSLLQFGSTPTKNKQQLIHVEKSTVIITTVVKYGLIIYFSNPHIDKAKLKPIPPQWLHNSANFRHRNHTHTSSIFTTDICPISSSTSANIDIPVEPNFTVEPNFDPEPASKAMTDYVIWNKMLTNLASTKSLVVRNKLITMAIASLQSRMV